MRRITRTYQHGRAMRAMRRCFLSSILLQAHLSIWPVRSINATPILSLLVVVCRRGYLFPPSLLLRPLKHSWLSTVSHTRLEAIHKTCLIMTRVGFTSASERGLCKMHESGATTSFSWTLRRTNMSGLIYQIHLWKKSLTAVRMSSGTRKMKMDPTWTGSRLISRAMDSSVCSRRPGRMIPQGERRGSLYLLWRCTRRMLPLVPVLSLMTTISTKMVPRVL